MIKAVRFIESDAALIIPENDHLKLGIYDIKCACLYTTNVKTIA
jgi:hypothetical protein